ncbi:porin [Variovorax sp. J22R133]|uniref:porin n=1 Tax=Variovorax brevis TaxID=3053503 RepID=UPI00257719DB|nr:porin [Variovorax sp. J22R133]MDM0114486.1 porin [Variovorax sp. J22R133]
MKKSLVALAALAVAGAASAQSSVTLFGIVDAAVSYYSNESYNGVKANQTALSNSGYNSSRLGFRGTEDLGGGLAASFWLEAGLANDVGGAGANPGATNPITGQLFNRRSTVSLSGGFGEVRLGRDYVPTFWNDTIFDPFGTNGVGTNAISSAVGAVAAGGSSNAPNYVRANNTIGYFLPSNLGGFYGQVMFGLAERTEFDPASATPTGVFLGGRYAGGRFGYANGPLDVAVAYGENTVASNFQGGGSAEVNTGNLGASWDFGFMKLMGEYSQVDAKSNLPLLALDQTYRGYLIGATFPVGPGLIRVAYSHTDIDTNSAVVDDPASDKFALGYVHNLSKRTALYATAAYLKNKNGATLTIGGSPAIATNTALGLPVEKSWGYDFGIRHSF